MTTEARIKQLEEMLATLAKWAIGCGDVSSEELSQIIAFVNP